MRSALLYCAALMAGIFASSAVGAATPEGSRRVEVIAMGEPAQAQAQATEMPGSLAPIPEDFRTHDLSRRWVAFEMANSFAATPTAGTIDPHAEGSSSGYVGPETGGSATNASAMPVPPAIVVPQWMRNGMAFSAAPTSFAPGCRPATYRPSGFLDSSTEARRLGYYGMMSAIACEYGIPTALFDAQILRESGYNSSIYSSKNAFGLTQLMPNTAAALGVNRYDVEQNLRGGARYLRQQLDRFGQVHLALAAYNAGPGKVRGGMVPRIAETQAYVDNVLRNWTRLAGVGLHRSTRDAAANQTIPPPTRGRTASIFIY